ncbi:MAG: dam [Gammaproteobacteria bacterium]|nr:dam [Gammaproteobacteria bacterium]
MSLNTNYPEYLLADGNPDLINLYQQLVTEGEDFIHYCGSLFLPANNNEKKYYSFREEFNETADRRRKSALFLYLNKHCYNGLCRYNKSGKFNTPFGLYINPKLPARAMRGFIAATQHTTFLHADFTATLKLARRGDVVYCDPPYAPLSKTAHFTDYHTNGFSWNDQLLLTETARKLADRGIQVVISNHKTRAICDLYKKAGAKIDAFKVQRNISCDGGNRVKADEILAVFS